LSLGGITLGIEELYNLQDNLVIELLFEIFILVCAILLVAGPIIVARRLKNQMPKK